MRKGHIVVPTNEGQELNYNEFVNGSLDAAKKRGKEIRDALKPILRQGEIGCEIRDDSGISLFFLPSSADKWEKS